MQSRKALAPRVSRGEPANGRRAGFRPHLQSTTYSGRVSLSPPRGYASVREPPPNRPMVLACCRRGSPDRHSGRVTACSSARPSGGPTWLSGSLRASRKQLRKEPVRLAWHGRSRARRSLGLVGAAITCLRAARRRSEHADGCCVAPEHGRRRRRRAAPRVSRSPSSRMVFWQSRADDDCPGSFHPRWRPLGQRRRRQLLEHGRMGQGNVIDGAH
jgi:hypothetical protein